MGLTVIPRSDARSFTPRRSPVPTATREGSPKLCRVRGREERGGIALSRKIREIGVMFTLFPPFSVQAVPYPLDVRC